MHARTVTDQPFFGFVDAIRRRPNSISVLPLAIHANTISGHALSLAVAPPSHLCPPSPRFRCPGILLRSPRFQQGCPPTTPVHLDSTTGGQALYFNAGRYQFQYCICSSSFNLHQYDRGEAMYPANRSFFREPGQSSLALPITHPQVSDGAQPSSRPTTASCLPNPHPRSLPPLAAVI
jgi:hypothetical protein